MEDQQLQGRLASRRDGAEVDKTRPTEAKLPAQQEVATANSGSEEVNSRFGPHGVLLRPPLA